eukprot:8150325-Lingulodinium_polyedra.AAC.1
MLGPECQEAFGKVRQQFDDKRKQTAAAKPVGVQARNIEGRLRKKTQQRDQAAEHLAKSKADLERLQAAIADQQARVGELDSE